MTSKTNPFSRLKRSGQFGAEKGGLFAAEWYGQFKTESGGPFERNFHLETLMNETGKLTSEQNKHLFAYAMRHNKDFRSSKAPWDDKYVGAIRLRYGYALTCHKAQGGEWKRVYVNPYHGLSNYRWIYTAVTRASETLYSFII